MRKGPRTTQREKRLPSCYEEGSENNLKRKKRRRVVMRRGPRTTQSEKKPASCYEEGSENNSKRKKAGELL
jgi:hypothetical protein